jgi:hypothetical protein
VVLAGSLPRLRGWVCGALAVRDLFRKERPHIGRAAVDEKIIGAGFLGEYAPSPGVG